MKKSIFSTVLLSGLVLSIAAPTALANVDMYGPSEETDVYVNLTKDDGTKPGKGPFVDRLAIAHVPTSFKFEELISDAGIHMDNKHDYKDAQYLAVNDDRRKAGDREVWTTAPWKLTAQLSDLTKIGDANTKLPGILELNPTELKEYNIGPIGEKIVNGKPVQDYLPAPIDPSTTKASDKYEAKPVQLEAGKQEQTIMTYSGLAPDAIQGENGTRGVHTSVGSDAKLVLAPGAASNEGSFKGKVTWTVASNP